MTREVLTANRTLYVRSDALYTDAPGRLNSAAGACKTWQQAVDLVASLDLNRKTVTIQHGSEGAHTFTEAVAIGTLVGGGQLNIAGLDAIGSTFFNLTGADPWTLTDAQTPVVFSNMKLQASGNFGLIQPKQQSLAALGNGMIFGSSGNAHIWIHDRQALFYSLSNTYQIVGGAAYHIFVNGGMAFHEASAVTLVGTPAITQFVAVLNGGAIQCPGTGGSASSFTGAATGQRYNASVGGTINTSGAGANFFPGNSAGATATGGQYA